MGCCGGIVKFFFFTFNLLICLCGLAVAGVGVFVNLHEDFSKNLQEIIDKSGTESIQLSAYTATIWAIVGVGAFIFLIGFLGCCGAACESTCLLGLFFTVVLILFLIEIALVAFLLVFDKEKFKSKVEETFELAYGKEPDVLQPFEETFKCCGVNNNYRSGCSAEQRSQPTCFEKIWTELKDYALYIGIAALALLVIEVLAMIFTCCLCREVRRTREYQYYY